jgi:hypothetical protein
MAFSNHRASVYAISEISGSLAFGIGAIGGSLSSGTHKARLLRDDGYVVLATAPFSVTPAP